MKKSDIINQSFISLIRNKMSFINIILLVISSAIIIFGFSYMHSLNNFWQDWTKKAVDFRTFSVSYDYGNVSEQDAISNLSKIEHVDEVTSSNGYIITGTAVDYINDKVDGQLTIKGVSKNSIKVISGENLEKYVGEQVIICPKKFYPYSQAYKEYYKDKNISDLSNIIGKSINIKIASSSEVEKFKLVGIYDYR